MFVKKELFLKYNKLKNNKFIFLDVKIKKVVDNVNAA